MPPPSSLIFVAIVVAWGAYLLPRWVSRRDALGQARGLDRFSSGLRVLDRRGQGRPVGPSTTSLLTTTSRRLLSEPAPAGGTTAPAGAVAPAAAPSSDEMVTGRPLNVADRARTAAVTAARRRRRVLMACLLLALAGWTGYVVELATWQIAVASTVLLPVDLVALVVSARARARRRRAAARAVAREVARADHWRQVHEHEEIRERDELPTPPRPEVMVGADVDRDSDTAEFDLRPVAAAMAAMSPPPPWRVDPADGVMLDDGPVTGSIPVWAMMTAAAASSSAAEAAAGWPQVERRVRDRRALRRPTPDRRASENLGTGRRLTAVTRSALNQAEGSWQPVTVPLPTYAMKSQAPRNPATLGADGVEPEVPVRPGVARPWLPERPGGEAVDLDEVLARRRAVNG